MWTASLLHSHVPGIPIIKERGGGGGGGGGCGCVCGPHKLKSKQWGQQKMKPQQEKHPTLTNEQSWPQRRSEEHNEGRSLFIDQKLSTSQECVRRCKNRCFHLGLHV